MKKITQRRAAAQRGLGLIESALGVMIGMAFIAGMAHLQIQANRDLRAKGNADSLRTFSQATKQYLEANRSAIRAAISDPDLIKANEAAALHCIVGASAQAGGGTVAVNRNEGKKTCAVDAGWLKYTHVLPPEYPEENVYRQRWTAIYRLVYADYDQDALTPETTRGDVEMLVVAARTDKTRDVATAVELLLTADLLGGSGGVIPNGTLGPCVYDRAAPGDGKACGIGGSWNVKVSDFVESP